MVFRVVHVFRGSPQIHALRTADRWLNDAFRFRAFGVIRGSNFGRSAAGVFDHGTHRMHGVKGRPSRRNRRVQSISTDLNPSHRRPRRALRLQTRCRISALSAISCEIWFGRVRFCVIGAICGQKRSSPQEAAKSAELETSRTFPRIARIYTDDVGVDSRRFVEFAGGDLGSGRPAANRRMNHGMHRMHGVKGRPSRRNRSGQSISFLCVFAFFVANPVGHLTRGIRVFRALRGPEI